MEAPNPNQSQSSKRAKRARDLLKDYYGIDETDSQKKDEEQQLPKRKDDIDGTSFEPEKYFSNLLHNKNLSDLLKTETQLQTEIKILDGEMKTLVYENYNKFISATETIKTMKSHVANMDEEMKRLEDNMEKISSYSDQINSTLANRRERIGHLSSVHRLIKKLQFLLELPARLNRSIELESYSQAVKYWIMAQGILKKYSQMKSFQVINSDCEKIIQSLKDLLRKKLKNPKSKTEQVTEAVSLLYQLNEDANQLMNEFLTTQKKSLEGKMNAVGEEKNSEESIPALNKTIVFELVEYAKIFDQIFIQQAKIPDASLKLEEWGRDVYGIYLSNLRVLFEGITETKHFIYILGAVESDLTSILQQNIPELSTKQTLNNVIDISVREHIEQVFKRLKGRVAEIIQEMGNIASETSHSGLGELCKTNAIRITAEIEKLLEKLKKLFNKEYIFLQAQRGVFFQRMLIKVQHFFLSLSVLISQPVEKDEGAGKSRVNPKFVLCAARLAIHLESESVDKIYGVVNSLKYLLTNDEKREAEDISFNVADLRSRLKQTAERSIRYYIKLQSEKFSQMLRRSIETPNWFTMKEARSPRLVMEQDILAEVKVTSEEILQIFEEKKEDSSKTRSNRAYSHAKNKPSYSPGIEPHLFQKKVRLGQEIQFNSGAILSEIIKVCLKGFVELIRLNTFGKTGHHQMQVDIYFLRGALAKIIEEEYMTESIHNLLDEALFNTAERTTEPNKLDQSILSSTCDEKISQMFPAPATPPNTNNSSTNTNQTN